MNSYLSRYRETGDLKRVMGGRGFRIIVKGRGKSLSATFPRLKSRISSSAIHQSESPLSISITWPASPFAYKNHDQKSDF